MAAVDSKVKQQWSAMPRQEVKMKRLLLILGLLLCCAENI
jgi:hypothetical protein